MESERRPAVGVGVIVRKGTQVLMGKRSGAHGENTWSFPGGHLEYGESIEECAARELREETGVHARKMNVVAVTNDVFDDARHYVTLFVEGEYDSGTPTALEPHTFSELNWFEWSNLPQPLFLPARNLIAQKYEPGARTFT